MERFETQAADWDEGSYLWRGEEPGQSVLPVDVQPGFAEVEAMLRA